MTPPPEGGVVDSRRPDGSAGQDVGGTPASRSKTRSAGLGTQPPPVGGGGGDGGGGGFGKDATWRNSLQIFARCALLQRARRVPSGYGGGERGVRETKRPATGRRLDVVSG